MTTGGSAGLGAGSTAYVVNLSDAGNSLVVASGTSTVNGGAGSDTVQAMRSDVDYSIDGGGGNDSAPRRRRRR